jgi:transposase
MWAFRLRRKDLTPEQQAELDRLFVEIPDLELAHYFREEVAEIFDTARSRQEASRRLDELRLLVVDTEPEFMDFFALYDRWKNGILAYFDDHETSAAVEGLNTKARVITRRSYGLKCAQSLWNRLLLDVNRFASMARRTIDQMHALARTIQAKFRGYYT